MSYDIQAAIKEIANSEAARAPRDPYMNEACANTRGTVTVLSFTGKETRDAGYGLFPVFRIDTVTPSKPGVALPAIGSKVAHPLFIQNDKWGYAKKDAKAIMLAILGAKASDVAPGDAEETIAAALKPEQPLRGMRLAYETYEKKGRNYVTFIALGDDERDGNKIAARRLELDKEFPLAK